MSAGCAVAEAALIVVLATHGLLDATNEGATSRWQAVAMVLPVAGVLFGAGGWATRRRSWLAVGSTILNGLCFLVLSLLE